MHECKALVCVFRLFFWLCSILFSNSTYIAWNFVYLLYHYFDPFAEDRVNPVHFSVLLHALPSFSCSSGRWFILLFVLAEEQFICLVQSDSHYLSNAPLVVIFVVHLYFYSIVDVVVFLLDILLTYSLSHIKLAYLGLFSFFKKYSKSPLVSSFWSNMFLFLVRCIHHYLLDVCKAIHVMKAY